MRTIAYSIVFATLLPVAFPGIAAAEDREIELGGYVGAHIFNDDNELGVRDQAAATAINSSFGFGFRLGFPVWRNLALEGELALMPSSAREGAACGEEVECPSVLAFGWRASAVWHFLGAESRVRPFALIGLGAMTSSSNDKEIIDTDTDLLPQAGAGLKVLVNERETGEWGVRVDGRVLLPPSSGSDGLTTDFEAWAGIYVTFGGPRVAPEPAAAKPAESEPSGATELPAAEPAEAEPSEVTEPPETEPAEGEPSGATEPPAAEPSDAAPSDGESSGATKPPEESPPAEAPGEAPAPAPEPETDTDANGAGES